MKKIIMLILLATLLTACSMQRYRLTETERTTEYLTAPDPTAIGEGLVTDGVWSLGE